MAERTLDWRPKPDPKSQLFRFATIPDCWDGNHRKNVRRTKTVFLDQGQEGACTGFGLAHVLAATPRSHTDVDDEFARILYHRAQRHDEWPGEDYEGSSVNGAMKAAREIGRIKEWRWAEARLEIRHGLSYHGAGELGVWWYTGMFDTDENGFIHATGTKEGGHALALTGYRTANWTNPQGLVITGVAYRLENSWGADWGDNGGAWIWESTVLDLLADDGELAFPVKINR